VTEHPHILNIFAGGKLVTQETFDDPMQALAWLSRRVAREKVLGFEWAQCLMCDPNNEPEEQWRLDIR
jgi:hypothetical protein